MSETALKWIELLLLGGIGLTLLSIRDKASAIREELGSIKVVLDSIKDSIHSIGNLSGLSEIKGEIRSMRGEIPGHHLGSDLSTLEKCLEKIESAIFHLRP